MVQPRDDQLMEPVKTTILFSVMDTGQNIRPDSLLGIVKGRFCQGAAGDEINQPQNNPGGTKVNRKTGDGVASAASMMPVSSHR